jgi:RNA polymerase sigma-70 factor (ECF subfamily)
MDHRRGENIPLADSSAPASPSVYSTEEFEALYRLHIDSVFRYALRCVSRRDVAEEITSDAFLALYRCREKAEPSRVAPWLFTTARNLATDHWRRNAVEQRYLNQLDQPVAQPQMVFSESILADPALKPEHRACLILRYAQGRERSEIAGLTGLSENQVKSYLQYGLVILRKLLGKEGAK